MKASSFQGRLFGVWLLSGLSFWAPALGEELHDIRVVNGKEVDLAPVHKWLANRVGERPMKHWREIKLTGVSESPAPGLDCFVIEGSSPGFVLLKNPPAAAKAQAQRSQAILSEMATLEDQIEQLRKTLVHAEAAVADANSANLGNPNAPTLYVKQGAWQRLEDMKERHEKLRQELSILAYPPILAMFTGQKLGGLAKNGGIEVWDCGKPR
jgi:hypothetical protein